MSPRSLLPLVLFLLVASPAWAEEPEADPVPPMATDEVAEAALDAFKDEWKARGYKGDIKTAVRERAMRRLAEVQHPEVTERLYKLTRDRNEDIRTLAVMYLGRQRALPGLAGRRILQAIDRNNSDAVIVMFGVDALVELGYRQQVELFRELLRHKDEMVRKVVILAIGDMQELRMFEDLLALAKELKIDKGWKEEGHEVRYDTGAAGDHDQKMAEKIYKDKYGNSARRARSSGRAMRDLRPVLLEAMKRLTGQEFYGREDAETWAEENAEAIQKEKKALDTIAEKQKEQEDELD
jgi:HEAT repeat protein